MQTPLFTSKNATKFSSKLALAALNGLGWKLYYDGLPTSRGVMIFYPHTSNWDFLYAILTKWATSLPLRFLAKEKLFQGISGIFLGGFLRFWGGEPIERNASNGAISQLAKRMQQADGFWLVIAPEGTRSYKPQLRSGFYHIALNAKVPLACVFIDYPKKEIGVIQVLELTGDKEADLAQIQSVYQHARGKYPEQQCPIKFKD